MTEPQASNDFDGDWSSNEEVASNNSPTEGVDLLPDEVLTTMMEPQQPSDFIESPVFLSDDDHSGEERFYSGVFEGPEKTLEVCFRRIVPDPILGETAVATDLAEYSVVNGVKRVGLRCLTRDDLARICSRARCTILSGVSNQYLDAYVLSESSLFVYPYMLVLKTCGTTTLLRCIATLIDLGRKVGLEIDWVGYSRKNFNFPGDQAFPHQSFQQELDYLYSHRSLCKRLDGNGYTLGPVTSDHWFVFVADQTSRAGALDIDTDRVLNIMMFDIDEDVARLFYYDSYKTGLPNETKDEETRRVSQEQTVASGIDALCPGALIDGRAFEPCGYSMNAILFHSYSTIHITPESGSSYVSFETNQKIPSYKALINNVVRTFRPKRFVMTLMADEGGLKQMKENPLTDSASAAKICVPAVKKPMMYKRTTVASIKVEQDCCCIMGNWILDTSTPTSASPTSAMWATPTTALDPWVLSRVGRSRGMSVS
jgi:S-adenosylmethionine decarboxylase